MPTAHWFKSEKREDCFLSVFEGSVLRAYKGPLDKVWRAKLSYAGEALWAKIDVGSEEQAKEAAENEAIAFLHCGWDVEEYKRRNRRGSLLALVVRRIGRVGL